MPASRAETVITSYSIHYTKLYERSRVARGEAGPIDDYGAESPGEFFAVLSEEFFERPVRLAAAYPDVYRQDPRRRLGP